jgi:histidinol dehydrogenase
MPPLKMRRIDLTASNSASQLAKLRDQFKIDNEVVSAQSRKLTQAVLGEPLTPMRCVERICTDVRDHGLSAVLKYTEQFDKVKLKADAVRVSERELAEAHAEASPEFLDVLRRICYNVDSFQAGLLHRDAELRVSGSYELHLRYRPLKRVGIYCPGGAAAYPSTLLMTVRPAQVAGVEEIAVALPPKDTGAYSKDMLATCHELGVNEVYRIGGAQAIAALAYGVEGIPPVDMIVGPGNQYVALAKKFVFGTVAVDCIAGPSEVVVVADDSAHPNYVALDLIAQAEHSPGSAVLVTWYEPILNEVRDAIDKRLAKIGRADLTRDCLERYGAMVLCPDKATAIQVVNDLAPEHLHIQTRDPDAFADEVNNAGAIFLGPFTPVAIGDYAAGPSHVLPTGGTARFSSGLTANDFRKRTSLLRFTRNGLKDIAPDVGYLAKKEGLPGHALSAEQRAADTGPAARPKPKPDKLPVVSGAASRK